MKGFIFRCNEKTEKEVFDRLLLGEEEKYFGLYANIEPNDCLFLYNARTYTVVGPLKPASNLSKDIEKSAWQGKFPTQIKFNVAKDTKKFDFKKIEKFIIIYLRDIYPYPVIEEKSLSEILNEIKDSNIY